MVKILRDNILFILAAIIIVVILIVVLSIFRNGSSITVNLDNDDGKVYGTYQRCRETAAGNFLVTFEHPRGWIVDKNGLASYIGYLDKGQISIYYVFESLQTEFDGYNKKKFGDRIMYWNDYSEEVEGNEYFTVDVLWPLDSVRSTLRFTCSGPKEDRAKIKDHCERFISSFRLD